jgi:hypothetical protein
MGLELVVVVMYKFWRGIYKFWRRMWTGKTELERICCRTIPVYQRTLRLEKYFKRSKQLAGLAPRLARLASSEDKKAVAAEILRVKAIAEKVSPEVSAALEESLGQMISLAVLLDALDKARGPYDSSNAEHEASLMRLWTALRPNVHLSSRKCEEWNEIGFQGRDPATDFRGMGLLGLTNMLELVDQCVSLAASHSTSTASHSTSIAPHSTETSSHSTKIAPHSTSIASHSIFSS